MCLKGKKIGIKFYILRQIAMREKFNFVPAFFVICKQETFDPAQLPQMLQETKQQIREKSCDPRVQESASEWIFHARFSISLLVVVFFFLLCLIFFSSFFLPLFLTSEGGIVTKIRPMEEDIAKLRGFHLHISQNTLCLLPKILHKHCL